MIEFSEIVKIELGPNDMLIFRAETELDPDQVEAFERAMAKTPLKNRYLILSGGIQVSKVEVTRL